MGSGADGQRDQVKRVDTRGVFLIMSVRSCCSSFVPLNIVGFIVCTCRILRLFCVWCVISVAVRVGARSASGILASVLRAWILGINAEHTRILDSGRKYAPMSQESCTNPRFRDSCTEKVGCPRDNLADTRPKVKSRYTISATSASSRSQSSSTPGQ